MAEVFNPTQAERIERFDKKFRKQLAKLERKHKCRIGVSFKDATVPFDFGYRGNELFHAASTMKVPVMIEVFQAAEAGKFALDSQVKIDPMCQSMIDNSPFECDAGKYLSTRLGHEEPVRKLVQQMIVVSDNLATNLLIRMVTPQNVTAAMRSLGARDGFVLRGVQDEQAFRAGISNRLTPNDLTTLMHAIASDTAASPASCEEMRTILFAQEYNSMIPAKLPSDVRVAHKTGSITAIHHDTAIVYTARGEYELTIMTDGIEDEQESTDLIAELSRDIYVAREPIVAEN